MYLSLVSSYISMGFTPTWLQILPNPQPSDSAYKEARDEAQVISTPRNNEGFSQTYEKSTYSCIDRVRVKKKKSNQHYIHSTLLQTMWQANSEPDIHITNSFSSLQTHKEKAAFWYFH